jgi:hypothetical protein
VKVYSKEEFAALSSEDQSQYLVDAGFLTNGGPTQRNILIDVLNSGILEDAYKVYVEGEKSHSDTWYTHAYWLGHMVLKFSPSQLRDLLGTQYLVS